MKKYAVIGVSNRSVYIFLDMLNNVYREHAQVVAMLDKDKSRMEWYNRSRKTNIPGYLPGQFEQMLKETRPEVVIVSCVDALHHEYVIKTLKHDLDVIVEKPLTIREDYCRQIWNAAEKSKGNVSVTFNYRYTPHTYKIREIIAQGKIGKVVSVDLNWYLDTYHGSSYFQRWNRLREMSGGLSVHKSCHHLDLVQWWIDQKPQEVFAFGARNFYGPDGVHNPLPKGQIGDGRTCVTCNQRPNCKYYIRWNRAEYRGETNPLLDDHVNGAVKYENYSCRQCIYDPQINIEDTYSAVIKYDKGAFLNYSLNGSVPYEGFRLGINGTEGRIEFKELHSPNPRLPFPDPGPGQVIFIPMFGGREVIDLINIGGSHGGGDPLMLDELIIGQDPLAKCKRQAGLEEGIDVVLTGVALYKSVLEHRPVFMKELRDYVFGQNEEIGAADNKLKIKCKHL